jgi:hypothetical protein
MVLIHEVLILTFGLGPCAYRHFHIGNAWGMQRAFLITGLFRCYEHRLGGDE